METLTLQRAEPAVFAGPTWKIDATTSSIGFSIKHMKFATVHGHFSGFRGAIRVDEARPLAPNVEAEIDADSIDTGDARRDEHVRSVDFFDVANYPKISFRSTRVEPVSPQRFDRWLMVGDLTIHGTSRAVKLAVEQTGDSRNPWLADVLTFTATTMIRRTDFGIGASFPLHGTGLLIGDDVTISIAVQALRGPIGDR